MLETVIYPFILRTRLYDLALKERPSLVRSFRRCEIAGVDADAEVSCQLTWAPARFKRSTRQLL